MLNKSFKKRLFTKLRSPRLKIELLIWKQRLRQKPSTTIKANHKKKYLIATNIGGNLNLLALDLVLARALKARGHEVKIALCNKALSACLSCELNKFKTIGEFTKSGPSKLCNKCVKTGRQLANTAQIETIDILPLKEINEKPIDWDEHATAATKRFLAIGSESSDKDFYRVYERFFKASIEASTLSDNLLRENKFDVVIAHHGIYVPQGNFVETARNLGIKVVTWHQAYRKGCYLFSLNDTYHKTMLFSQHWNRKLSLEEKKTITTYLESRKKGTNDWINFGVSKRQESIKIDFPPEKTALLLTNVSWDAQIHYNTNIFESMQDWLRSTINWYSAQENSFLIIRVHPAEVTGNIVSRDPVVEWINENYESLPGNIKIISPEDRVSTYSLMNSANLGLVYATKASIELATLGKEIIVAGDAWVRGKGFTHDPISETEYLEMLKNYSECRLEKRSNIEMALSFAYFFFFQKMIPISSIEPLKVYPYARPKEMKNFDEIDPGLMSVINSLENEVSDFLYHNHL
jgi:hypothetical protein